MELEQVNNSLKKLSQNILNLENAQNRLWKIVDGMDKKIQEIESSLTETKGGEVVKSDFEQLKQELESFEKFIKPSKNQGMKTTKLSSFDALVEEIERIVKALEELDLRMKVVENKIDQKVNTDENEQH